MTHDFFWKLVDPKKQAKQAAASASGAYAAELGYDIPAPPPHLPRTSLGTTSPPPHRRVASAVLSTSPDDP